MQKGLLNYFQPKTPAGPGPAASSVSAMLKVGMEVYLKTSKRVGMITKLARNEVGLVVATAKMTDGELITGSPTVGKDFERKEEGDSKKFQKESAKSSAVIVLNSSSSSHEENDDFDLDEIQVQRLEDAALKDVDECRVSGKVSLGFSKSAEERAQEASPLTVKKREHAVADPLIFAPKSNGSSYSPLKPIKARALPACAEDGGGNVAASSATPKKEMTSPTAAMPPTTDEKLQKDNSWRRDDACEVSQMSTQQKPTQQQKPKPQELSRGANIQAASANSSQKQKQGVLQQQAGSTPQGFWWWLEDRHVRDAEMRRPQDDDYDPSTVFIPKNAFATMTDFQKQYWEIKRVNFDMLIMAKLGKFYELYENDAEIAHKLLYLNYTYGGRDPNSKKMLCVGVPENSIDGIVGKLVAQRYKVGIVEEMERASDLKKAQTMGVSSSARKVVDRSLRRIFTPGTMSDEELLGGHEPKPLCVLVPQLAASAAEAETLADTLLGVCLIDCSTARINIGTVALHELDVLLRAHRPHEVVYPRGRLHGPLKSWLKNSTPLAVWTALTPGHHDEQFWPADVTRSRLGELADLKVLADLLNDDNEKCNLALNALGGAMAYLKKLRLDRDLLSLRNFHDLHGLGDNGPKCMLLDIQTLNGLDVLEPKGCEGKRSGGMTCLWHYLDRTVTPFGKRLLRWWVTRPLLQVHDIRKRSAAVQDLLRLSGAGSIVSEVEMLMKKLPDLERKITRIHAFASLHSETRRQGIAEAAASQKRACRELVAVMQAQTQLTRKGRVQAFLVFDNIRQRLHQLQPDITSSLLQELISALPNVSDKIQQIQALFNVDLLSKNADSLQPREGTDRDYEAAKANRTTAEKALHELLFREKTALQCSKMKFSGSGKDPWLLEMPADFTKRGGGMPPDYELQSETKTCRRYTTPKLQKLLQVLAEAKDDVEIAQRRASARLCALFDSNYAMWCRAVTGLSEFDALLSLAQASESSDGQPMCPAEIIDRAKGSPPILTFSNMRHPFLGGGGGTFVPNDVSIGKADGVLSQPTTCLILTGPNMGGKSTTLRLACFAALLAQLGCHVPAEACKLTPVDRIFTRLGADDDICRGLSTFLVEMKDIQVMLREATDDSLVIIDELGRGTSTFDGHAIAYAVLLDLLQRVRCRTLLSTHYHGLVQDFRDDERIVPMHMACKVEPSLGQLVMLYKLQRGVCPRSYGMECARSAGLPEHIIQHARIKSQEFENAQHQKTQPAAATTASTNVGDAKREGKRAHTEDIADIETMRKVRRVLDLFTQSSQALQGKDILPVYRKLTEIWENLS